MRWNSCLNLGSQVKSPNFCSRCLSCCVTSREVLLESPCLCLVRITWVMKGFNWLWINSWSYKCPERGDHSSVDLPEVVPVSDFYFGTWNRVNTGASLTYSDSSKKPLNFIIVMVFLLQASSGFVHMKKPWFVGYRCVTGFVFSAGERTTKARLGGAGSSLG